MPNIVIGAILAAAAALPLGAAERDANFHLYLLVGQSNMAGRGAVDEAGRTPDPRVLMFAKAREWVPAVDPVHFDKPEAGVGPARAFAAAMAAADPSVRIGLIPCAVGGTPIAAWQPGASDAATKTHPYDDMLARARAALPAGVLKGIIWHQGEADRAHADVYGAKLAELVQRLRKDLDAPDVPFVAGELASFRADNATSTATFNAALAKQVALIPRCAVVSSEGTHDKGDKLHFNTASARLLGRRYAEAMLNLQKLR